jgi:hypothetical protein
MQVTMDSFMMWLPGLPRDAQQHIEATLRAVRKAAGGSETSMDSSSKACVNPYTAVVGGLAQVCLCLLHNVQIACCMSLGRCGASLA